MMSASCSSDAASASSWMECLRIMNAPVKLVQVGLEGLEVVL